VIPVKIGILAVQGDFQAHAARLQQLGAEPVLVRRSSQLEGLEGLILPGGESTTQLQFLTEEGLAQAITERARQGLAIFGTCAGAILLAREVRNPQQPSLGLMDITVVRNAYGRQLESTVVIGRTALRDEPLEMVFIRAPVIEQTGPGVTALAWREDRPVLVRQGRLLAATFHPELTADPLVHQYFLKIITDGL
jgi:5'-phosphate synthase pdxT subunit